MDENRKTLYEKLEKAIGKTPLYEMKRIKVPNGNRIFVKEEYKNPTGSHYDRVFLSLLRNLEEEGKIHAGDKLVETTSGNAGASFAWLCDILGYHATVIIPEDMPSVRFSHISSLFGANLVFSPKGEYVIGVIKRLRKYLRENKGTCCTNHAESEHSIEGMKIAGKEIIRDLKTVYNVDNLDYFFGALGSGVHLTGIWEGLRDKWPTIKIIGVEPFECPDNYIQKYGPDKFIEEFRIKPSLKKHGLLGIGRWGNTSEKFPHMDKMRDKLAEIILVENAEWSSFQKSLRNVEFKHVGRTSSACACAVLKYIEKEKCENENFLTVFYDPAWKYLNIDRHLALS